MEEIIYKTVNWDNADLKSWYAEDSKHNFLYNYNFNENSKIIDIGSYDGTWLKKITKMYNCYGIGVEPVNKFYTKSLDNNNIKVQFTNIGLTKENDHRIKINLNSDCTNIFDTHGDCEILLINAINFFQNIPFKTIDLLQINIEGYEYELIPYMIDNDLFNNVSNVQIQFHSVSNFSELKYMDIKNRLNSIGFKDKFDFKFVWYGGTKL
jgi:FkbM family methyltransferase